jgi:hypothetical protein
MDVRVADAERMVRNRQREIVRAAAPGPRFAPATRAAGQSSPASAQETRFSGAVPVSMDGLLFLQGEIDPKARRRAAAKRAGELLDGLERLKLAMLRGGGAEAELSMLCARLRTRERSFDPGLDAVVDAIELRVGVELAKRGIDP